MERSIKCKPNHLCMIIFMLCLSVRFVEYFLIETDKTAIRENELHKVVGIILLALVLKKVNLTWGDIGFQKNGLVSGILKGLLFMTIEDSRSVDSIVGNRLLCCFVWVGIGNFSSARQSCAFGNLICCM